MKGDNVPTFIGLGFLNLKGFLGSETTWGS